MIYLVYYQRFFGLLRPAEVRRRWLNFSHRRLKTLAAASPDEVYRHMQAEVWSPQGQARRLIRRLRLGHTSLSVGDVVHSATGEMWVCDLSGWRTLPAEAIADHSASRPPLWLATELDYRHTPPQIKRLKLSDDRACLQAGAYTVEPLGWTAFADLVDLAHLIEQRLGWSVCIDLGNAFYETAINCYVGYHLVGQWPNAIISVYAPTAIAARQQIEAELGKPGRQRYWQLWVRDGRLVKRKLSAEA